MLNTPEFKIRCRAVIIHDGKLLVVDHGHTPAFFALPGGHLDLGEDPQQCLRREIIEELGVEPNIGRLLYVHTLLHSHESQSIEFFFEVTNSEDFLDLLGRERTHAHEIEKMAWVTPDDQVRILPEKVGEDFKAGNILHTEPFFIKG